MPRGSKRNKGDSNEDIESKLLPLESSISSTQDAVKVLEETTKQSISDMKSEFDVQMKKLQDTMDALLQLQDRNKSHPENNSMQVDNPPGTSGISLARNLPTRDNSSNSNEIFTQGIRLSGAIPGPEKIVDNLSLAQFKDWRRKFQNYLIFQGLENTMPCQVTALLTSFFSQDITDVVRLVLKFENINDVNATQILDKLEDYFRQKENGRIRRSQFMTRKQEPGESFVSFYREKVKLFQLTDPCIHCYDRCLADHIIETLFDSDVRRKCRILPDSVTVDEIFKLCQSEEAAILEERRSHTQVCNINNTRSNLLNSSRKCPRCKEAWHKSLKECKAKNVICGKCHRKGHYTECCFKKSISVVDCNEDIDEISKIGCLKITSIGATKNNEYQRQINVSIRSLNLTETNAIVYPATPDTGAEVTVAGEEFLLKLRCPQTKLKPTRIRLESADSSLLKVIGSIQCNIQLEKSQTDTTIYICVGVKELLLDRKVLVALGIIHRNFPKPLSSQDLKILQIGAYPKFTEREKLENIRQDLLRKYHDVFNSEVSLKPMIGKSVHIHLKEKFIPYAISCPRKIPFAWRKEVKNELDEMVKKGIIKPIENEPTDFISPLVVVQKQNGRLRICVDFTMLNRFVKRPIHPFKSPWEAVSSVNKNSKFFSSLDATSGYWQLKLDNESQKLTTFLTPWGRYHFLRAPMGLVSSGDEYCRRGDEAFTDIQNIEKVVDDILVFDETFETHYSRVIQLLERCRNEGITLNPKKFVFAQQEIKYVGYKLSVDGIEADPDKVEAIQKFPRPTNLTELRSFLGLVNQLGQFSSEISINAVPLRSLLQKKNEFLWTQVHDEAYEKVRSALVKPPILAHFDPTIPTELHTDASRRNGIGYALLQKHECGWKLIQCGSRFISDTESRYATIELELLAMTWAVHKCRLYLLGLDEFQVVIDHKPLIPIINSYTLDRIENPRIQRLKEKLAGYNLTAIWKKGKEHLVPDALSRSPVLLPHDEDLLAEDTQTHVNSFIVQQIAIADNTNESTRNVHLIDSMLLDLKHSAEGDDDYQSLIKQILAGFPCSKAKLPIYLRPFWNIKDELSIDNGLILKGCQILIPKDARKMTLKRLHDSHQGIQRTCSRARQTVYWPGMTSDIKNMINNCESCQSMQPSLPKETKMYDPKPEYPFHDVSADLFSCAGKHYMVYVDRLSGWPIICHYGNRVPSGSKVIVDLRKIFSDTGVPLRLRTDNGPQFNCYEFRRFLKNWNVATSPSTPYYAQSNGHAEAAVKAMKYLISKCIEAGQLDEEKFCAGLLEWRNTPGANGRSPAQTLFGHPMRSLVPTHLKSFRAEWQRTANECDIRMSRHFEYHTQLYNRTARDLEPISIGQKVRLQDPNTNLWDRVGVVTELGRHRNYTIMLPSGRILIRNRRFLRPIIAMEGREK